jgi:hypothetical protein
MTTQKRLPYTTYIRHIFGEINRRARVERSNELTMTKSPKTDWVIRHDILATLVATEMSL